MRRRAPSARQARLAPAAMLLVLAWWVTLGVALGACAPEQRPAPPPAEPAATARAFVVALNADNLEAMRQQAGIPFALRTQDWQSAPDGAGMVLGAAQEARAESAAALDSLLRQLTQDVQVEDVNGTTQAPDDTTHFAADGPLRGAPGDWRQLRRVVFLRGAGDIEHIAIVGVSPATGRVVALYVN